MRATTSTGRTARLLDVALDSVVALFAVWTLVYHVGLWVGATRLQVVIATLLPAGMAVWWMAGRGRHHPVDPEEPAPVGASRGAVGSVILALVAVVLVWRSFDTLFWVAAAGSLGCAAFAIRSRAPVRPGRPARIGAAVVVVVATLSGLVSATQVEWIQDNTYYVDRALAIRDADGPLPVGRDSFFSADGRYPSLVPENDLASLEGLVGTAAAYLGGHPMSWLSYLVHPAFAFFGVVALWRAARALGSRHPHLVAVFGTVAVYLLSLQSEIGTRTFSSRTGRNGFVAVLVPLLVAYAAELVRRPGMASAVRFVAAGVAAGGFTLSALPVAPVVAVGAGLAVWHRPSSRQMAWIGGSLAVMLGHFVALTLAAFALGRSPVDTEGITVAARSSGDLWQVALGRAHAYLPLTVVVLLAWGVATTPAVRRWAVSGPGVALLLLGPPALMVLRRTAAGTALPRLGWALPLGLITGIVLAALWDARRAWWGRAAAVGLLAVQAAFITHLPALRLAPPAWDVPPMADSARRLVDLAPPGGVVGASWAVSAFVPVVSNEVFAVAVYRGSIREIGATGDATWHPEARTEVMSWLTEGTQGREPHRLASALDVLDVDALCVREAARSGDMRRALRAAGFDKAGTDRYCQFWVRG